MAGKLLLTGPILLIFENNQFATAQSTGSTGYLITNDDYTPAGIPDSATLFTIATDGTLSNPNQVKTIGTGAGGGYFASKRFVPLNSFTSPCVYLSALRNNSIISRRLLL